ncbi:transforming growth factor-beta-induced protein ig-h3 [Chrysoperla carnea]|uniref:transforming growth factor-beta-induced protein ig-h3 n=1 Tax=Chrysoperla carnea TaxID=189513 RepID=UPI001D0745B3|nr:transforming growth factor-beta-induced protein ig-h3 [Chrysoperla carnea]
MARQNILLLLLQCGSVYITQFLYLKMFIFLLVNSVLIQIISGDVLLTPTNQQQSTLSLLLPDTSGIDGQLTANYNIDNFFSLWLVFHNDDIKVSDQPFTIFAPINSATKDTNSYLRNSEHVKNLLLSHIVLGTQIDVEKQNTTEENYETLSGRTIHITKKNQKLYANDALIINQKIQLPAGVIIIIDNYVLGKANLNNTQHPENIPVNLLTTISGTNGINSSALIQQTKNTNNTKFIDNIYQVLSFFKEGVRVFQHFLSKSNVSKVLKDGQEYTVLVPCDSAFQRWHPIDWGFYPFSVPEFTEDVIRNHFIIGNIRQNSIKGEEEVKTLGGRILKFSLKPTLNVNGVTIAKGDTAVKGGNLMFINEVLFVSESIVSRLHQQHKDKETPPLLAFPWFGAQFLSHAFLALEGDKRFTQMTRFLNLADLAQHVSGTGYTFFVPIDTAFEALGLNNMPDNYLSTGDGLKLLLNHFVKKRLYKRDFINNTTLTTLGGDSIRVIEENGNITLNEAHVVEGEVFVYNLGTMYFIDKLLFPLPNTLQEVIPTSSTTITTMITSTRKQSTETIPEELDVEVGTSTDLLLEESTDDGQSNTYQVPFILSNKLNISNPIK